MKKYKKEIKQKPIRDLDTHPKTEEEGWSPHISTSWGMNSSIIHTPYSDDDKHVGGINGSLQQSLQKINKVINLRSKSRNSLDILNQIENIK